MSDIMDESQKESDEMWKLACLNIGDSLGISTAIENVDDYFVEVACRIAMLKYLAYGQ